jgi:hypothetical protein
VQGASELGHPVTAKRPRVVDPKHSMLVAVERDRLAPSLQIGARRVEVGEGRLALDKLQMHQPAGRVIDKHQQGALRSAVLEPPVLAAIDLDQFADAIAPRPRLVNPLALLAIAPQPSFDHPLAQCLTTKGNPMILAQLLGRQGRAKIPVPLANDRQNRSPQPLRLAPVAAPTASLRDQTSRTCGSVRLQQPKYLTALEPEQLTRRRGRQSPLIQIAQHLQPRKFAIAHQKNRHPQHPPEIPQEVSSLIGRRVTF